MEHHPINQTRLLATFLDFAGIDSPSRHEAAMMRRVRELLWEMGVEVTIDDAAASTGGEIGNLIARLPGTIDGPALLFCAHLDTVEPTTDVQVQHAGNLLTSDGTTILGADDKAGVATIIEMLSAVKETGIPHPPLEFAFTVAEEVGLMGSTFLDYAGLTAQYGFVPDGSGPVGAVIVRAPAQKSLRIAVHGKAAHAGVAPEKGVNAITVAARAIAALRLGRIDEETTANIGIIQGGKATNIVPDLVELQGEARSRNPQKLEEQAAHMRSVFEEEAARAGATVDIAVTDAYPAFNLDEDSVPVRLACAALETLGLPATVTATGGGSDANFINAHGIQTVILSAGYENPHSVDERLDTEQLTLLARQLYEIVKAAGAG